MRQTRAMAIQVVSLVSAGSTEVMAATPAATDTATVNV